MADSPRERILSYDEGGIKAEKKRNGMSLILACNVIAIRINSDEQYQNIILFKQFSNCFFLLSLYRFLINLKHIQFAIVHCAHMHTDLCCHHFWQIQKSLGHTAFFAVWWNAF